MFSISKISRILGYSLIGILLLILNWYFLWTATLTGERLPYPLEVATMNFVYFQYDLLLRIGLVIDRYTFADLEAISAFVIASMIFFFISLNRGVGKALLRTAAFSSLSLMPLGIEVYFLDHGEFWIHVTNLQVTLNMVPWFSNGDLLILTAGTFMSSLFLSTKLRKKISTKTIAKLTSVP
jgi:hypothetical protein